MVRNQVCWLGLVALLLTTACGGGPAGTRGTGAGPGDARSDATASVGDAVGDGLTADGMDDCARVTAEDIRRVTGYETQEQRGYGSGCGHATPDGRFSVTAVGGRYVDLRSSLGGEHVPLARGLTGYVNGSGWLSTVIYPDGTSVSLVISGSALSHPVSRADYRVRLADGREVEAASLYRAFADAIVANSR